MSRRTDDKDQLKFVIEKQVGETGSGQVYELKTNQDGESVTKKEQQQRGAGADRFRPKSRRSRLQTGSECTTPGFIVVKCKKFKSSVHRTTKRNEKTTVEEEKIKRSEFESRLVTSLCTVKAFYKIVKWEKPVRKTGTAT